MSQNRTSTDFPGTSSGQSGTTGQTSGAGQTSNAGQTGTGGPQIESFSTPSSSSTGSATGTATALAQEYGSKISEAATQAKDYVTDKVSVVGDKIKELQNADLGEIAENAKDYARQNPGQAILISAAAGLLLGLIIRGRR
ncbi:MAG TPA: hypothetical protein VK208_17585 [Pyrinomonadaceae bacterium]|jgi:ElaB/YqjD/DUF883 family membrane-anchored ribosome-binding protein|nr:hypothetical protein [Pyrinomonadaceae bacterium]